MHLFSWPTAACAQRASDKSLAAHHYVCVCACLICVCVCFVRVWYVFVCVFTCFQRFVLLGFMSKLTNAACSVPNWNIKEIVWTCFKVCLALHNDMFLIHTNMSRSDLGIFIPFFTDGALPRTQWSFTRLHFQFLYDLQWGCPDPQPKITIFQQSLTRHVPGTCCTASATSHAWRPRLPWDHRWQAA